jgi:hypothetical protein
MMRKILLGFALVTVFCFGLYLRYHHAKPPLQVMYAGNHEVMLWNTTAQVREPVVTVNYGERLDVLRRFEDEAEVRTTGGLVGWVNQRELLSADLWEKAKDLTARAATMTAEAHGHTRVLANLHIEPGRDAARLRQLSKLVPVDLMEREAEDLPVAGRSGAGETEGATEPTPTRKEDWWLVLAHVPDEPAVAGWVLGQFIDLDVPQPLPDYASAADMRIVAWFPLDRVTDSSGNTRPQYLVVGTRGPEGQACDFTMMRVYTWGEHRQEYETAFVDSKVCGKLPVRVTPDPTKEHELTFSFEDIGSAPAATRIFRMHQTLVRAVKPPGAEGARRPGD